MRFDCAVAGLAKNHRSLTKPAPIKHFAVIMGTINRTSPTAADIRRLEVASISRRVKRTHAEGFGKSSSAADSDLTPSTARG